MHKYSLEYTQRPIAEDGKGHIFGFEVPQWAETAASFVPILGSAMDVYDAVKDPSLGNIGNAVLSTSLELAGLGIARSINKAYKASKAITKTYKATEKLANDAGKGYNRLIRSAKKSDRKRALRLLEDNNKHRRKLREIARNPDFNNLDYKDVLFKRLALGIPIELVGNSLNAKQQNLIK